MYDSLASELEASDCSFGGISPFLTSSKNDEYSKNTDRKISKFIDDSVTSQTNSSTPTLNIGPAEGLGVSERPPKIPVEIHSASVEFNHSPENSNAKPIVKRDDSSLAVSTPKRNPSSESLIGYLLFCAS